MVLDGPINGDWFEAYVAHVPAPTLRPSYIVIMDNLSSHKRASVKAIIEASGAQLSFLPTYSPDFNPIENASPSSRHSCERPPSALSTASGPPSDVSSTSSRRGNAQTTSPQQDTIQIDREPL
jgi:hypothetical protein